MTSTPPLANRPARAGSAALLAGLVLLGACAIRPAAVDPDTDAVRNKALLESSIAQGEPVNGPISLYEAMARALKYNLDGRIEQMDEALRLKQVDLKRFDMLPSVVASTGYSARSNDAGSRSRSLLSGQQSLEPSTSSERRSTDTSITASWDVLDFGLAYVRSMQQADEAMIAGERRRKVMNRIVEDVRTAYWRAVSADRTFKKLGELEVMARKALAQAEELEKRRIAPPLAVLTYQRDLLSVQSDAQRLQRELTLAKTQLAALMNLPPQTAYDLVLPDRTSVVPELPGSADDMILTGLRFRAELREASYRRRITNLDKQAAFLRALPSVKGLLGLNHDSNEYLYNRDWLNFSARISWNLLGAFRYPAEKAALEAEIAVLDQRDLALTMAVATQVHVARVRFVRLAQELGTIRQSTAVQARITQLTRGSHDARAVSQQNLVREEMNAVLAEVRYDAAYADLQNAYANIYASMGLDNYDIDVNDAVPLKTLSGKLEEHWNERAGSLPEMK